MQFSAILLQFITTAAAAASASALPVASRSAYSQECNLECPRVIGNSIGVPQFCAIVNGKPLCVPSPPCGGFGGGIGGGVFCPAGFKCVPDDLLGAGAKMCVPT